MSLSLFVSVSISLSHFLSVPLLVCLFLSQSFNLLISLIFSFGQSEKFLCFSWILFSSITRLTPRDAFFTSLVLSSQLSARSQHLTDSCLWCIYHIPFLCFMSRSLRGRYYKMFGIHGMVLLKWWHLSINVVLNYRKVIYKKCDYWKNGVLNCWKVAYKYC